MTTDMTQGNTMMHILKFALPMVMGNLFQQIYNIADSIIVGRTLGTNALAAVGASASLTFLIIGFVTGCCSGFAIPVAQCFGGKKYSDMRKYVTNSYRLVAALSVILTVATCFLCSHIFIWMHTPAEIKEGAYNYMFIIFLGIPFTFLYNSLAGIIRSLGDSRTPFLFLVFSSILNIIGDYVLIIYAHMGVRGAGIATIGSQAVSGILCLIYMRMKYDVLKTQKYENELDMDKIGRLLNLGVPMGLQFSITAIGSIMLQTAINGLGTVIVTGYAAAMKIKQFTICPYDAIGTASATFAAQNLGAGNTKRVYKGLYSAMIIGVIYSIIAYIGLRLYGGALTRLFIDTAHTDAVSASGIVSASWQYVVTIGTFYTVLAALAVFRCTIQGLGYSPQVFFAGVLEMIARTGMSLYVIPVYGFVAACFTDVVAWVCAVAYLIPLFFIIMNKLKHINPC